MYSFFYPLLFKVWKSRQPYKAKMRLVLNELFLPPLKLLFQTKNVFLMLFKLLWMIQFVRYKATALRADYNTRTTHVASGTYWYWLSRWTELRIPFTREKANKQKEPDLWWCEKKRKKINTVTTGSLYLYNPRVLFSRFF